MKTYEIIITVVTDVGYKGVEADAKWLAEMMAGQVIYGEDAWVESVETVAQYDVRDPEARS